MPLGKTSSEKPVSLSREVRSLIEREPYIRNPLADGLINYSALARSIAPRIEQKLNRRIKEESLIVAIKRYADEISGKTAKNDYLDIFAKSTLSMQEDVSYALLNRSDEILGALEHLLNESDWHSGEVRIIIEAPERVVVVLKTPRMNSLMEKVKDNAIDFSESNALITMREPIESRTTYGVIAEIASVLSRKGISIELISAPPDLHFLVDEKDAEEAYKSLKEMIKTAKQALKENSI